MKLYNDINNESSTDLTISFIDHSFLDFSFLIDLTICCVTLPTNIFVILHVFCSEVFYFKCLILTVYKTAINTLMRTRNILFFLLLIQIDRYTIIKQNNDDIFNESRTDSPEQSALCYVYESPIICRNFCIVSLHKVSRVLAGTTGSGPHTSNG